jgi:hypothetical protein
MLDDARTIRIIEEIAKSKLGRDNIVRVFTKPGVDSEGKDAVRITIVITPDAVTRIKGDALLDNLLEIHNRLSEAGEARTPIVGYATEEELAEIDDPES